VFVTLQGIDKRYNNPVIYITENGSSGNESDFLSALHDYGRREYFEGYVRECGKAIRAGVDLRRYFVWPLMTILSGNLDTRGALVYTMLTSKP